MTSITSKKPKGFLVFNVKCPKCDASIGADHLNDLIAYAYTHFIDAHVVGGSFD